MVQAMFSLSWELHKNNICNGLGQFQQNGEFVDMTLAADGHHVKVHQMVMALASPYLKELITSAATAHPVIFLNKVSYRTLSAILEYIYTGEAVVSLEQIDEVMQAARDLHVKGLETMGDASQLTTRSVTPEVSHYDSMTYENDDDNEEDNNPNPNDRDEEMCYIEVIDEAKNPSPKYIYEEEGSSAEYSSIAGYKGESRWYSRAGHHYVASRSRGASTTMRCCRDRCPARWTLRRGAPGPVRGRHDHAPMPWIPNRNIMFQNLKRRTATESTPLKTIFKEETAKYPDAAEHVAWESVAPSMRKWRQQRLKQKGNSVLVEKPQELPIEA